MVEFGRLDLNLGFAKDNKVKYIPENMEQDKDFHNYLQESSDTPHKDCSFDRRHLLGKDFDNRSSGQNKN